MVRDLKIDWITLGLYLLIVTLGWFNLYSISAEEDPSFVNLNSFHGKQAVFVLVSIGLGALILFLDTKFLEVTSYFVYGGVLLALLAVLAMSKVAGASSWFEVGGFKIQPTEFAKVATLMALGKYISRFNFSFNKTQDFLLVAAGLFLPVAMVLLQNDAGSALVFMGLVYMLYREGLHPAFLAIMGVTALVGIVSVLLQDVANAIGVMLVVLVVGTAGVVVLMVLTDKLRYVWVVVLMGIFLCSLPLAVNFVVKPYQSARIRVLVASEEKIEREAEQGDPSLEKARYQLRESLVAIGSGGVMGKGYGNGTHTRNDFVPEEHTDYIFCVIGEEHGFIGTSIILVLFFLLILRIIYIAENSKSRYARVYGYGMASILFMHLFVNVGMTIGLVPTIGIPLPFFSYGGSSMLAFTLMLFILMNHYSYRQNIMN